MVVVVVVVVGWGGGGIEAGGSGERGWGRPSAGFPPFIPQTASLL